MIDYSSSYKQIDSETELREKSGKAEEKQLLEIHHL